MAALASSSPILKCAAPDLLRDLDLTDDELTYLLDLADDVKRSPRDYSQALAGKSVALLFEKPSLRTSLLKSPSCSLAAAAYSSRGRSAYASR
ncbi:MAG: hypothetical protein ABSH56_22710 [Bryobacteraceae bacterium]